MGFVQSEGTVIEDLPVAFRAIDSTSNPLDLTFKEAVFHQRSIFSAECNYCFVSHKRLMLVLMLARE
jgi:hypothetical protein